MNGERRIEGERDGEREKEKDREVEEREKLYKYNCYNDCT